MSKTTLIVSRHERRRQARELQKLLAVADTNATKKLEAAKRGVDAPPATPPTDLPVTFTVRKGIRQVVFEFDRPVVILGLSSAKSRRLATALNAAADAVDTELQAETSAEPNHELDNSTDAR